MASQETRNSTNASKLQTALRAAESPEPLVEGPESTARKPDCASVKLRNTLEACLADHQREYTGVLNALDILKSRRLDLQNSIGAVSSALSQLDATDRMASFIQGSK